MFVDHLRGAPVAQVASEEAAEVIVLNPHEVIAVSIDPLNGTSNVDIDGPLGTVFSLLPSASTMTRRELPCPGSDQLAAGFILYGPYTALVLTLGDGVNIFTLDPRTREFVLTHGAVRITPGRREYAINASNGRHWPLPIRAFVEECVAGADGPRGVDYNTRWLGTVVSEAYRILYMVGSTCIPATHGRATGEAGYACCMKPTRSPCWSSRQGAWRPTATVASSIWSPPEYRIMCR